ncbi:relaxase/mobilization nuclease domain-containing protein [Actinacidiphila sp. DG2A-62]|uniref:relaxase/mobilization nuclease domain-containing protein n=1 Tax=Actinacidiphila sp. DG2A-62 TaxID=3108821 RepID=UPI002DB99ADE|nr:relaxase/mobilization nuclease domain-containing protein [Actinacidiphila sp. DG2A-62]MEC3995891.1 relaxase/mobilization nuclease domain-containing protein [Actinacidiphila sp. DG2A-62]
MIPSIHKPGSNTAGAIGYLYRTGRGHEAHTDPHLVASLDGLAPDPGRNPDATFKQLAAYLDLPVNATDPAERPDKPVWHCSVRAAPEDPILTDNQWADIARRMVAATGIAPEGDDGACRWIAVRHADDHIHILATKVRQDGTKPRDSYSYKRAQAEARQIELDYGLRRITPGDGTAAERPTRAETEKALRTGRARTPREQLRTIARTAVAVATSPEEYLRLLARSGVQVDVLHLPSGDIRGYKVALDGDTNAEGQPIWFSGSTLAPDLSYPQIRARLSSTEPVLPGPRRPNPWHQATTATERIPHHLAQNNDPAAQAHITAFAEALDVLPLHAPEELRPQLRAAATAFERASRSRVQADHHHARALRNAVRALARQPSTGDGATLAMFLDAALLAVIAIQRWQQSRHQNQQVEAARRTLTHLQAAYAHAAAAPLAALAHRAPPRSAAERHAGRIRQTLPAHADHILDDPHWPVLATTLADAESAGHDVPRLLRQAVNERALTDARSPAQVLTWRLHRLTQRPPLSPQAQAARARSTVLPTRRTAADTASSQPAARRSDTGDRRHR